jgi:hypothetical protein
LLSASAVVLVRPGDVFAFSGGVAHTTLSVSPELNVAAYESLVTLHPAVVAHFLHTGEREGPFALERGVMEVDVLDELRTEVVRRLASLAGRLKATDAQGGEKEITPIPTKRRKLEAIGRDACASDSERASSGGVARETHAVAALAGLTEALSGPLRQGTGRALRQLLAHAGFRALLERDLTEDQLRPLLGAHAT